jgi:hypothetical protein
MIQNFSVAFQQMASFLSISKLRAFPEILEELVQQSLVILPSERHRNAQDVSGSLQSLFGLQLHDKDIQAAIDSLVARKAVQTLASGSLALEEANALRIERRIQDARELESRVKVKWISEADRKKSCLAPDDLWKALRDFLQQAFRRHGIQVATLVDPNIEVANEQSSGLSYIVDETVAKLFPRLSPTEKRSVAEVISSFFDAASIDNDRARYISGLADGAFNYFSLSIAPDVSKRFRDKLDNLTIFMDTNFLFGILDLHLNTQVDVSAELVQAISDFKLPFKMRYHEATSRELTNTLTFYGSVLRSTKWPQAISRAAHNLGALSGIELKYHQLNAERRVDVEDFLAPYQQWQILLKSKGIDVYRGDSSEERLRRRANLEDAYRRYFAQVGRTKSPEAIQHDIAVLEAVRSLRTPNRPALESGAMLLTCDNHLFRFDSISSRQSHDFGCTMLPSVLWQVLRPFVADASDYDKAFAESFGVPEFSLGRGNASKAATKMLSILAGYKDIPEETAAAMLSSSMVLSQIERAESDEDFYRIIDNELARQNTSLIEELAEIERQKQLEQENSKQRSEELAHAKEVIAGKEAELARIKKAIAEQEEVASIRGKQLSEAAEARQVAEAKASNQQTNIDSSKRQIRNLRRAVGVSIGLLVSLLFYFLINTVGVWPWLQKHDHSVGIQASAILLLIFASLGIAEPNRRLRLLWFAATALPVIGALLTIL